MARGDYDRRVRATSRDEVGRSGARVQRDGGRARGRGPHAARTGRQRLARAAHAARRAPGAAREPRRRRRAARSGRAADGARARPSGSAGSSRSCSTCHGWRAAGWRSSRREFGMRELLEQAARECALGDRPVRLKVCVEPGDLQAPATRSGCTRWSPTCSTTRSATRRPRAACGSAPMPRRPAGRRSWSPTRAPASRPRRPSACSSASTARTPRARRATGAPGSGSRSRAGSSTPTAARSAPSSGSPTAAGWSWSCRVNRAALAVLAAAALASRHAAGPPGGARDVGRGGLGVRRRDGRGTPRRDPWSIAWWLGAAALGGSRVRPPRG